MALRGFRSFLICTRCGRQLGQQTRSLSCTSAPSLRQRRAPATQTASSLSRHLDLISSQIDQIPELPAGGGADALDEVELRQPGTREGDPILASYKDTLPPSKAQLKHATRYFTTSPPKFLHGTAKFRTLPVSNIPEVAFIGRSNVGKSSLLNALFGREKNEVAWTSKRPGRTKEMNAFGVGGVELIKGRAELLSQSSEQQTSEKAFDKWVTSGRGLVVMDMPGYGKASRDEWGREIMKYLTTRTQLRRVFVLINAEHGIKPTDEHILQLLRESGVPHQIVLTKVDEMMNNKKGKTSGEALRGAAEKIMRQVEAVRLEAQPRSWRGLKALGDVLVTSSTVQLGQDAKGSRKDKMGVEHVRWAVLQATGQEGDAQGRDRHVDWTVESASQEDLVTQ